MVCNALKSCLKVGGLDQKNLTQSFVRILELPQKEADKSLCVYQFNYSSLYFVASDRIPYLCVPLVQITPQTSR